MDGGVMLMNCYQFFWLDYVMIALLMFSCQEHLATILIVKDGIFNMSEEGRDKKYLSPG